MFFNPRDFGETALIDGKPVNVLFDREYLADAGFALAGGNADPFVVAADADLPPNLRNAEIAVRGRRYTVAETEFDGTGLTVIQLREIRDAPAY